ncbi:MAG: flagellar basal-body rod protein FlgF [Alphaproteobacteria bacterium]|nr:flagellar basal-body rod protein FlgF [Alphaproteobacteria bacterium]
METAGYVGLSGQLALEQRLVSVANNVANAATVGYKAEGVQFEAYVSDVPRIPAAFAVAAGSHVLNTSGGLVKTDNPLDVAIQGESYLSVMTPAGPVYTRDGRMQILPSGDLASINGHPVLDAGGAPILVDPSAGPMQIGRDGMISQGGRQIGAIGLFKVDLDRPYQRYENSAFIPSVQPEPVVSFGEDGFIQGFVEQSNVNPILEMTNLIKVTRAFEALATAMEQNDSLLRNANQALGGRS